jgi:hypothetical protein
MDSRRGATLAAVNSGFLKDKPAIGALTGNRKTSHRLNIHGTSQTIAALQQILNTMSRNKTSITKMGDLIHAP